MLGKAAWWLEGRAEITLSAKDAALLAKLALDGPQARSVLCTLLWPDAHPKEAAASLRQRTSRLFRAAGGVQVVRVGDPLSLAPHVEVDVCRLDAMDSAKIVAADGLLAGVDLGQFDELDQWLSRARAQVTAGCVKVLTDRAEALEHEGRLRDALPLARRVTELQPLAEHGWRRLMRLHYLRNDRAAAQDAFWRLNGLMRDELGIGPSPETLQLMQTLEAAEAAPAQQRQPVPVSVLRPPVLVGRNTAKHAMAAAWQQKQAFLLIGSAGLGKSRLLEDWVFGQSGFVFERAQPGDEDTPYSLLGRILVAVDQRFSPATASADRVELARLRPEFGPAPAAPAHEPVLWHAAEGLLAAALDRGLQALVLDDLHCADRATLAALRWLGASPGLTGLRLGLATRPILPAQPQWTEWLQDSQRPIQIELQPLTLQELSALLASLALPAMLDPQLSAKLYRHAGGHPLFTLATLQDALSRGADLRGPLLPRPSTVQSLLDARLSDLPSAAQDLLRVAAVAGPDLRADRVARLLGCTVLALSDAWATLEAANVLRGESFSHDLVYESALRAVPQGVRQALHRQMAALLAEESVVNPARLAWHWQQGECWSEAGRCCHAAGQAAHRAGRLVEAGELFERAGDLHLRAGDSLARFEALHARLEGLQLRHGGMAVMAALPEVEALAESGLMRLRCRLARVEALGDSGQWAAAAAEGEVAAHAATKHPDLLAKALALQAGALVQCGQVEPAQAIAHEALTAAGAANDPRQRLYALDALSFVYYSTGHLADAVEWQEQAVAQAEAIGHRAEAFANEGHLAALLANVGDVPGTYAHALRVQQGHRQIGLSDNSTFGIVNHITLGVAAAALGRFDQAWDALHAAVAMAGAEAAPAAQAKARLSLASLWLTLGRPDHARDLVTALPDGILPAMRMQAEWVRARAADMDGLPASRHLQTLSRIARESGELPLVQSAWWEWSFTGDAAEVVARLQQVGPQFEALGLRGTARGLRLRQLARCLEVDGEAATAAALAHALALEPFAASGLSARCHPPLTWQTLWRAFGRAGDAARQQACQAAAQRWLDDALPSVPAAHRDSFVHRNAVHRWWMVDRRAT